MKTQKESVYHLHGKIHHDGSICSNRTVSTEWESEIKYKEANWLPEIDASADTLGKIGPIEYPLYYL